MKKRAGKAKEKEASNVVKAKIRFDLTFWILIAALIALPLGSLLVHMKLHSQYTWLTYFVLFDIIIISLMYFSKKTIFYAFILNTTFFITGVIAHLTVAGGIGDVLMAIPDFAIGYALWVWYR